MLAEFLMASGWVFWAVVFAVIILDAMCLCVDGAEGWAVFLTVAALTGAVLFTDAFAGVRPAALLAILAVYLTCGVLWSIKKWYSFVVDCKNEMLRRYNTVVNKTAKGNETWESFSKDKQPKAADNKQRIVSWMALWPFSFTWWVLTWPRHAFTWCYERLTTLFDRISAKVFAS